MSAERAVRAGGGFWGAQDLVRRDGGNLLYKPQRGGDHALPHLTP